MTSASLEKHYRRELARISEVLRRKKLVGRNKEASLFLLPNREMRALKKRYLKKDVPVVDVLSFPAGEGFPDPEGAKSLGEIYLNSSIARRAPKRARYLIIHGFLHLLGYRHSGKRDTITMESLEKEVMARI